MQQVFYMQQWDTATASQPNKENVNWKERFYKAILFVMSQALKLLLCWIFFLFAHSFVWKASNMSGFWEYDFTKEINLVIHSINENPNYMHRNFLNVQACKTSIYRHKFVSMLECKLFWKCFYGWMNYDYFKPIMPFIFSWKDVIKLNNRLLLILPQLKQITKK